MPLSGNPILPQPSLSEHLRRKLASSAPEAALCIAFSGGADSSALLHALAALPQARQRGLRALHIDHQLHPDSADWARHCMKRAQAWEVPCEVLRVRIEVSGEGIEAAAREARYRAFGGALAAGEILLLAQHRDDQVETVLLKLLRGAGPEGLAGMRESRPLGAGKLWRPLLALPRAVLAAYLQQHALDWIEDPSNADQRLARNYLRADILPRLDRHWPQAAASITHSSALCRQADDALRERWLVAYTKLHDSANGSLDAAGWLALPPGLRHPLLDHWLHQQGFRAPSTAQRAQLEHQQRTALPDRLPCIRWQGVELHLWRGRWWATPPICAAPVGWAAIWRGEPLVLPGGGELRLNDQEARLPQPLQVRLRHGGERLKPVGHAVTRELRDLFQQGAVPPWLRPLCPLLYLDGRLLAVADRWSSAEAEDLYQETAARPLWRPFPIDSKRIVQ